MSEQAPRRRRPKSELVDRILAAARAIYEETGVTRATTAAIARRAEVTEAQLFRYFPSKADLFREAVFVPLNRHFLAFTGTPSEAADGTLRSEAARYVAELQALMEENGKLLLALMIAQDQPSQGSNGIGEMDSLAAYFDRGATMMAERRGSSRPIDPRLLVRISFAAVLANSLFRDWLFPKGLADDDEIDAAVSRFVLDGLGYGEGDGSTIEKGQAG